MADYIDRDLFAKEVNRLSTNPFNEWETMGILMLLDTIPSADVQPVVRCKECRHRDPEDHKCDSGGLERAGCVFSVSDDYFCAYGEV